MYISDEQLDFQTFNLGVRRLRGRPIYKCKTLQETAALAMIMRCYTKMHMNIDEKDLKTWVAKGAITWPVAHAIWNILSSVRITKGYYYGMYLESEEYRTDMQASWYNRYDGKYYMGSVKTCVEKLEDRIRCQCERAQAEREERDAVFVDVGPDPTEHVKYDHGAIQALLEGLEGDI